MRNTSKILSALAIFSLFALNIYAGNKDRIGSAGGTQLNVNPWARSASFGNANSAAVTGIEATYLNVSGLAFLRKTEVAYNYSSWLSGSGIGLHAVAIGQRVGEYGVLGAGFTSFSLGDIKRTEVDNPDGDQGNFRAQFGQFYLSYAREFSNSIYAGVTAKFVTEGVANARANGAAFDIGIRYVTGVKDNLKFGVSLRNVGGKMRFQGDGLSTQVRLDDKQFTLSQRSEPYELPVNLNIGVSYDYLIGELANPEDETTIAMHRLTGALNFMSNSFGNDQVSLGVEYAFRERIMLRAAYLYEDQVVSEENNTTAFSGPSGGVTVSVPFNKKGTSLDIDYGFRANRIFNGTHTIGLMLNL
jgi:hypothetical protein